MTLSASSVSLAVFSCGGGVVLLLGGIDGLASEAKERLANPGSRPRALQSRKARTLIILLESDVVSCVVVVVVVVWIIRIDSVG